MPEGGAGQLTAALVRRLTERGGVVRCNAPVVTHRGARPPRGRRRARRRRDRSPRPAACSPTWARPRSTATWSARSTSRHAWWPISTGSSTTRPRSRSTGRSRARSRGAPKPATQRRAPSTCATAWTASPRSRPTSRRTASRRTRSCSSGQMNKADPTRSPAGTETVWAYTHVPLRVRGDAGGDLTGKWDASEVRDVRRPRRGRDRGATRPASARWSPAGTCCSPPALEARNANLAGGALGGGTTALSQQAVFRPIPGLGRAETPVRGLFLASASAHPGGGVHGACGANAARAAIAAAPDPPLTGRALRARSAASFSTDVLGRTSAQARRGGSRGAARSLSARRTTASAARSAASARSTSRTRSR